MALNLPYKIKKFFQGEFGIVERIEPPTYKYTFGQNIKCLEDDEDRYPSHEELGTLVRYETSDDWDPGHKPGRAQERGM